MAAASAYFFSRRNQQTHIDETVAGPLRPLALVPCLHAVKGNMAENAIVSGANDQGTSRLIVSRVPAMRVHERRRKAGKNAQKQALLPPMLT